MINIQKQIDYWINSADEDIVTAELLIQQNRNLYGLFFCHLAIEKAFKAHYVKKKGTVAPRTHNLIFLSEETGIVLDPDILVFLGILMKYQLEGRYPDFNPIVPKQIQSDEYFNKTRDLLKWLKVRL